MAHEPDDAFEKSANLVADILGSLGGAGAGLLIAGPPGALAGAAGGPGIAFGLRAAATELLSRRLTRREHSRVEQVVVVAAETIRRNLSRGEQPRADWSPPAGGASSDAAEEIAEGVLLAAQREYEERKLALIGRMLGNMQFRPELDRGYCNHLLRAAQELSYRQLRLLALFIPSARDRYRFVGSPDVGNGMGPIRAVLHEIFDLSERSMLQQAHPSGTGTEMVLNATHEVPARTMTVTGPRRVAHDRHRSARTDPSSGHRRCGQHSAGSAPPCVSGFGEASGS